MSYTTIHRCANDPEFLARLEAAAAQEGQINPEFDVRLYLRWPAASASDIEDAYEFAINSGNPSPGGDPAVITDQQILGVVQATIPTIPTIPDQPPAP